MHCNHHPRRDGLLRALPKASVNAVPYFLCCLLLVLSSPLLAQERVADNTQPLEELMETEIVYPQEKNELQLTFGTRIENENGATRFVSPVSLEYGITDSLQVGIEWNAIEWRSPAASDMTHGMGDIELGMKYSVMRFWGPNTHAALVFRLGIPAGDAARGFGEGRVEFEPSVILARDLPRFHGAQIFTQIGLNAAHVMTDTGEPAFTQAIWNFGVFVPHQRLRFILEATTQSNAEQGMDLQAIPGIAVKAPGGFEVGIGFSQPLGRQDLGSHLILKVSREFGGGAK